MRPRGVGGQVGHLHGLGRGTGSRQQFCDLKLGEPALFVPIAHGRAALVLRQGGFVLVRIVVALRQVEGVAGIIRLVL